MSCGKCPECGETPGGVSFLNRDWYRRKEFCSDRCWAMSDEIPVYRNGMYMGGRDLVPMSEELGDAAFDAVLPAWIAGVLAIVATGLGAFLIFPAHGDASMLRMAFVLLGVAGCWLAAGYLSQPWLAAMRKLREHRDAIQAETDERGAGWATA